MCLSSQLSSLAFYFTMPNLVAGLDVSKYLYFFNQATFESIACQQKIKFKDSFLKICNSI